MEELKLWIPNRIVPKARPRFHQGRAMLPLNYRRWQSKTYLYVQKLLRDAYGGSRSDHRAITGLPFEKATVEIQFVGSHLGDLDNLAGAILDVMTKTNILRDDRISCIPKLILSHEPGETCGAWVRVEAMVGAVANKAKAAKVSAPAAKKSVKVVKKVVKTAKKPAKATARKTRQ